MAASASQPPSGPIRRSKIIADAFRVWLRNSLEWSSEGVGLVGPIFRDDVPSFRTNEYRDACANSYVADIEDMMFRIRRSIRFYVNPAPPVALSTRLLVATFGTEKHILFADPNDDILRREIASSWMFAHSIKMQSPGVEFSLRQLDQKTFSEVLTDLNANLIEFLTVRLNQEDNNLEPNENPQVNPVVPQRSVNAKARSATARSLGAAKATLGTLTPAPHLPFKIHASHSNLDVEYSPAYFASWVYFGGPTTPVDGWLLPGLYRFRGRDVTGHYRFDPTKYKVNARNYSANTIL